MFDLYIFSCNLQGFSLVQGFSLFLLDNLCYSCTANCGTNCLLFFYFSINNKDQSISVKCYYDSENYERACIDLGWQICLFLDDDTRSNFLSITIFTVIGCNIQWWTQLSANEFLQENTFLVWHSQALYFAVLVNQLKRQIQRDFFSIFVLAELFLRLPVFFVVTS